MTTRLAAPSDILIRDPRTGTPETTFFHWVLKMLCTQCRDSCSPRVPQPSTCHPQMPKYIATTVDQQQQHLTTLPPPSLSLSLSLNDNSIMEMAKYRKLLTPTQVSPFRTSCIPSRGKKLMSSRYCSSRSFEKFTLLGS